MLRDYVAYRDDGGDGNLAESSVDKSQISNSVLSAAVVDGESP